MLPDEKIVHLKPQTSSKEFKQVKRPKVDNLHCESKFNEDKVVTPPKRKRGAVCENVENIYKISIIDFVPLHAR